ncbi:MAG: hypothetical protein LBK77_05540, partial [Spirochaetaceae bacterium]|nr:hypothetical protein [Spirochaetaceae bacterium]
MAHKLRARLTRIREQRREAETLPAASDRTPPADIPASASAAGMPAGWTSAGYRVLRRKLTLPVPVLPAELPDTLPLLIPDAA